MAANIDHLAPLAGSFLDHAVSLSSLPLYNLYGNAPIPQEDVHFWASFDRVISWTGSSDPAFSRNLKHIHPGASIAGWKPGPQETRHVAQIFIDSLGPEIAAGHKASPVTIVPGPQLDFLARQWLQERGWTGVDGMIALHPGAGSVTKQWPPGRFAALCRYLSGRNKTPLVIEGPSESGLAMRIAAEVPRTRVLSAVALPLDLLAAVIRRCEYFVGNDSGIAHLAAALGIPSMVLFGPTSPTHWAPLGPDVTVLKDCSGCAGCLSSNNRHSCLENISVECLVGVLEERLSITREYAHDR